MVIAEAVNPVPARQFNLSFLDFFQAQIVKTEFTRQARLVGRRIEHGLLTFVHSVKPPPIYHFPESDERVNKGDD